MKRIHKKLSLRSDTVRNLRVQELEAVAGGAVFTFFGWCPVNHTGICGPTQDIATCPTIGVLGCADPA